MPWRPHGLTDLINAKAPRCQGKTKQLVSRLAAFCAERLCLSENPSIDEAAPHFLRQAI
jgi:hypothetical protein